MIKKKIPTIKPEDWDKYNWDIVEEDRGKRRMKKVLSYITKVGLHLDVGIGIGDGTALISKYKPTIGLDYGSRSLGIAKGKNNLLVQGTACFLPFKNNIFRSVTCLDVLEHIPDAEEAIKEIYRVLSPGSICVLQTPTLETERIKQFGVRLKSKIEKAIKMIQKRRMKPNSPIKNTSPKITLEQWVPQPYDKAIPMGEIKRFIQTAGFELVSKKYIWYWTSNWILKPFCISDLFILRN